MGLCMPDASTVKDPHFNPLCAWLGFPPDALPCDYYALLGLPRFESDTGEINRAAETLIAHVREIRPGPYLAEWTQLLDTIRAAKACLCDPEKKQAYDQALRTRRITTLDVNEWSQSRVLTADVDNGPEPSTAHVAAQALQTSPSLSRHTTSVGPTANTETVAPSISLKHFPTRKKPNWLAQIFSVFFLLVSVILAYQMLTAPAWWGARLRVILAAAQLGPRNQEEHPVSFVGNTLSQDSVPAQNPVPQQPSSSRPLPPAQVNNTNPVPPLGETPGSAKSENKPDREEDSGTSTSQSPASQSSAPMPPATGNYGPNHIAELPNNEVEFPNNEVQMPTFQEKQGEEPHEMSPSVESPTDYEAAPPDLRPEIRSGVVHVWQAMAKRNLEAARSKLDQLAGQVTNEAEQQAVEVLDYLLKHVEEFWRALHKIVSTMQAGEEFAIGDAYIVVVEATSEELVIRAAGQNRRYLIRQMPSPLIRLIVSRRFRPGPEADALLGAFLAVDPEGSPQEAEQLWRRANDGVLDVEALLEALKLRPEASPK